MKRNLLCPSKLMGEKTLQKDKIIGSDDDKHSQVNQSGSGRTKG